MLVLPNAIWGIGVFSALFSWTYPTHCPWHSQEEAEDTKNHPAVRFVSIAVHCLSWVRSSSNLGYH